MEVACPICNKNEMVVLIKEPDNGHSIHYCKICNVGVTIPIPSPNELIPLYSPGTYRSVDGNRFIGLVEAGIIFARQLRRKRIEKHKRKGRILDIGCGRGVFLDIMKKNGWTVAGTEYNREAAETIVKNFDIQVVTGNPEDWGFPPNSFDVVTMNHVLEHMSAPENVIIECSRILVEGGLLVVAVPNITSLQSSLGKHLWFHLDIPHHIFHFSEKGLAGLLEKQNFRPLKTRQFDMEYNPFGLLQTFLNLTGIRKNFLFDLLKNRNSRDLLISHHPKWNLIATIILAPLYFPIALLLALFESYFLKKGGTIEMYAVKK